MASNTDMDFIRKRAQEYLSAEDDPKFRKEVEDLLAGGDAVELTDRFYTDLAFGTGGLWGTGIGKGYQKLFYLPEPHTDFVFSVIGEELGLLGVSIVLILYAMILWRGVIIARNASDAFGAYIAIGLTAALGLQVVVNMGVALGLLPTKVLPLPFLSYGGSSLLVSMAAVGVLMNIGAKRKAS